MKNTPLILTVCTLAGLASLGAYPNAIDIPPGPPGKESDPAIGGAGMTLSGTPISTAPILAAMNKTVKETETLVITGHNLSGMELLFGVNGDSPGMSPPPAQFILGTNAQRSIAVTPNITGLSGTTLVFGKTGSNYSAPFRINGPEIFWLRPETIRRTTSPVMLQIFGRNLAAPGATPKVYLDAPGTSKDGFYSAFHTAHENMLEVNLSTALTTLPSGSYSVWVHNGTGKSWGWSEERKFEILSSPVAEPTVSVAVTLQTGDANAAANANALESTINANPGKIITLSAGNFPLDRPINITAANVSVKGNSWGSDGDADYFRADENPVSTASATTLRYVSHTALSSLLVINAPDVTVQNLVLANGHAGGRDLYSLVTIKNTGARMKYVRFFQFDERNWGDWPGISAPGRNQPRHWPAFPNQPTGISYPTSTPIDDGALFIDYPGEAQATVESCKFYLASAGVRIGRLQNSDLETAPLQTPTSQVRVEGCTFEGYWSGSPDRKPNSTDAGRAVGICVYNGRETYLKSNIFQSYNREGRALLNRSVLTFNSSTRHVFATKNTSTNVGGCNKFGSWPISEELMPENQSESYLFHYRYTKGGIFTVVSSGTEVDGTQYIIINPAQSPADPGYNLKWYGYNQVGGWLPAEVGTNDHWVAMIASGKGAGQYAGIAQKSTSGGNIKLKLAKNMRLLPDSTNNVLLYVPMRENVLYDNDFQSPPRRLNKLHFATLWQESVDTIITKNRIIGTTAGITINSHSLSPCSWNLIKDNEISGLGGDPETDTAIYQCFVAIQHHTTRHEAGNDTDTLWPTAGWYNVGNVVKNNICEDSPVYSVLLCNAYHGDTFGNTDPYEEPSESLIGKGMQMNLVEFNTFTNVMGGVFADCATHYGIVRKNSFPSLPTADHVIIRSGHASPLTQVSELDNY